MKKHTLSPDDVGNSCTIELHGGYSVRVTAEYNADYGPPWKECDGHGPVSDWTRRKKAPGERVLEEERDGSRLYYDVQGAIAIAKRDGWDTPPYNTGTKGERAARAVSADFEYLRKWCVGDWEYVVVEVEVYFRGEILEREYCGGIESFSNYWKEQACDMANAIVSQDREARKAAAIAARAERREARYWRERDTATV